MSLALMPGFGQQREIVGLKVKRSYLARRHKKKKKLFSAHNLTYIFLGRTADSHTLHIMGCNGDNTWDITLSYCIPLNFHVAVVTES